jgi:hypothetical protein
MNYADGGQIGTRRDHNFVRYAGLEDDADEEVGGLGGSHDRAFGFVGVRLKYSARRYIVNDRSSAGSSLFQGGQYGCEA